MEVTQEGYDKYIQETASMIGEMATAEDTLASLCEQESWHSPWSGYASKDFPENAVLAQYVADYTHSHSEVMEYMKEYIFRISDCELSAIIVRTCEKCVEEDLWKALKGE